MELLFPEERVYPPGFEYLEEFINDTEERILIEEIRKTVLHTFRFQGYEAKRKVASYGWDYSFENRSLRRGAEIPSPFVPIILKASEKLAIASEEISELLITEYPPGSVINWHRDAPPFDVIVGISLLSDCIFKLRPHDKNLQTRQSIKSFPVRRRSLYIMRNEARSDWQHSIAPVKSTRYSITLGTLRSVKW